MHILAAHVAHLIFQEKVRCLTKLDDAQDLGKALANKLKDADHIGNLELAAITLSISVPVEGSKPHPLKYIQLEQVNSVFGAQDIAVLPEPVIVDDHASMANPVFKVSKQPATFTLAQL